MQLFSDRLGFFASSRHAQSPRAVFGRSARTPFGAEDPSGALGQGPAAYDTTAAMRAVRSAAPRAAFARASRDGKLGSSAGQTPAPNSYETGDATLLRLSSHPAAPRARIGSAPRDRHSNAGEGRLLGPGPGAVLVSDAALSTRPSAPRTRIGSAQRDRIPTSRAIQPGPASYEVIDLDSSAGGRAITRPRSARAAFSRAPRLSLIADGVGALGQGPAAYETIDAMRIVRNSAPRAAFCRAPRECGGRPGSAGSAGRPGSADVVCTPAPNAYDTGDASLLRLSSHPLAPRARIGSASRLSVNRPGFGGPAPNAYVLDLSMALVKPAAPRASIGRAPRGGGLSNANALLAVTNRPRTSVLSKGR